MIASRISASISIFLVCLVACPQAFAGFVNGGFETGDFTGWQTLGTSSVQNASFGDSPTEGNYQALILNHQDGFPGVPVSQLESFLGVPSGSLSTLGNGTVTQGSAISQAITVGKGDVLTFDWNFLTNEDQNSATNDFAFLSVSSNSLTTLANTFSTLQSSSTIFNNETGYETSSFVFNAAGTYTISFGIVDVGDTDVSSGLLLDNVAVTAATVPEPTSMIPLGIGMVTMAGYSVYRGKRQQ